jgi:hypothetical protein
MISHVKSLERPCKTVNCIYNFVLKVYPFIFFFFRFDYFLIFYLTISLLKIEIYNIFNQIMFLLVV